MIPGNHESASQITDLCDKFGLHDFHGSEHVKVGEFHMVGLGYSNPTPFDTPGEYSEEELEREAACIRWFEADDCGVPRASLRDHAGPDHESATRRKQGDARISAGAEQPRYFFCGHIHEAAGAQDKLGATSAMNVGKKGYLLDLDKQTELGFI